MKPGSIIMLILGTVLSMRGLMLTLAGGTAAVVTARGGDGYLTSPARSFSVQSFALTSPRRSGVEVAVSRSICPAFGSEPSPRREATSSSESRGRPT
ncbi:MULTISPECIES: hypothetical protein [Cryobacterium]|uniref:Secreted protein n=1 Tax=Cryobacterium breve TaxID=1259258 RepID=A0ABY2J4B9_9MICO|nr:MULTISPECIES: hypothetical protein [Cryobacterium]TFC94069.1 hypothetical protein E3T20_08845 [Cryobacterium sp. TmT3-12]TFC98700.1 hypothetical protein E3O65_07445 [Cryobacterium breve]